MKWSKEDSISRLNDKVEGSISVNQYQNLKVNGKDPDYATIYSKFGSWNNAKEKLGLKTVTGRSLNSNKEECKKAIMRVIFPI